MYVVELNRVFLRRESMRGVSFVKWLITGLKERPPGVRSAVKLDWLRTGVLEP